MLTPHDWLLDVADAGRLLLLVVRALLVLA